VAGYPIVGGRILAAKCEINVVEHCNLACRSCSHLSPVLPRRIVDPDVVYRDLTILSHSYHADWVRLLGGEPLMHPDLLSVIEAVVRSNVADAICVVTNGLLLPRMPPAFWQVVDRVDLSMYPGRELDSDKLRQCQERADSYAVELNVEPYTEFRQSYSEAGTDDRTLVRAIYDACRIVHDWRCHTVSDGRFYKCPQSYFLPKLLGSCNGNGAVDSIAIEDTDSFRQDLLSFLESTEPLATCGYCLGTSGRRFAHAQVKRSEFRSFQQRPAEELVDVRRLSPLPLAAKEAPGGAPGGRRLPAPAVEH
jgi:organic radical activating enzyme